MAEMIHPVHDTDKSFTIDPITRAIKNDTLKKLSLVIDDHNSEVFTFELPRHIEGHDMAGCNKVEIHYVNTHSTTKEKSADRYKVTDYRVSEEDPEKVVFSWTISKKATTYPGPLAFAIHFACMDEITEEVRYWWSTATNNTITVLDCINLTEEIEEENKDLQEKTATPTKDIQVVRPDGDYRGLSRVLVEPIPDEYIIPTGTLFVDANGEYSVLEFDKVLVSVHPTLQEKELTANGTHTPDSGYEGFSKVTVNVADVPAVLQEKTVYPSTSEQTVEPDRGFDGLSKVTVGEMKLQSKSADQNGEIIADDGYHGLQKVTVRVNPTLQDKSLDITENGDTEVIADSGYYGLGRVSVHVNVETAPPKLQEKTATENGEVTPDEGYDGLSKVKVNVVKLLMEKTITENGTYTPPVGFEGFSQVTVNVAGEVLEEYDGTITIV